MTEWQPIETAPRDGTRVFLWLPEIVDYQRAKRIETRWWGSPEHGWWGNEYGNGPAYNTNARPKYGAILVATSEGIKPSHWMPLPQPPEVKTGA